MPYPPDGLPYMCLIRDQVFGSVNFAECVLRGAVDSFVYMERGDCLCILLIRGVCYYIITPPSLKKRENSVYSIIGLSEIFKTIIDRLKFGQIGYFS